MWCAAELAVTWDVGAKKPVALSRDPTNPSKECESMGPSLPLLTLTWTCCECCIVKRGLRVVGAALPAGELHLPLRYLTTVCLPTAARMAEVADPEEGLRVESASRLDWDRDRWLRRPLNAVVNPVKADSDFMSKLLFLLRKVIDLSGPLVAQGTMGAIINAETGNSAT